MDTEKIKKTIQSVKHKVLAVIGEFLKNGEKLEFMETTIKKIEIEQKPDILKRIEFLKARQEHLLTKSKKFTDDVDIVTKELDKYKGMDLRKMIGTLGWRTIEVIKKLINQGTTLAKMGTTLISEINTQNKDVQNLETYIAKSTKEGFKFEMPKLEKLTKPVAEVLKPVAYIVGGIAIIYLTGFLLPKPRRV